MKKLLIVLCGLMVTRIGDEIKAEADFAIAKELGYAP